MHATPCSAVPADAGTVPVSAEEALEALMEAGDRLRTLGLRAAVAREDETGGIAVSLLQDDEQADRPRVADELDLVSAAVAVAAEALRARGQARQGASLVFRVVSGAAGETVLAVNGSDVPLVVPLSP